MNTYYIDDEVSKYSKDELVILSDIAKNHLKTSKIITNTKKEAQTIKESRDRVTLTNVALMTFSKTLNSSNATDRGIKILADAISANTLAANGNQDILEFNAAFLRERKNVYDYRKELTKIPNTEGDTTKGKEKDLFITLGNITAIDNIWTTVKYLNKKAFSKNEKIGYGYAIASFLGGKQLPISHNKFLQTINLDLIPNKERKFGKKACNRAYLHYKKFNELSFFNALSVFMINDIEFGHILEDAQETEQYRLDELKNSVKWLKYKSDKKRLTQNLYGNKSFNKKPYDKKKKYGNSNSGNTTFNKGKNVGNKKKKTFKKTYKKPTYKKKFNANNSKK